jgi:isopentenyldiphosphate isomerase
MTHSEEEFDIYDGEGTLLGQAPRSEVHRRGLWHKAVNVLLFSTDGRLYLQRRAAGKDVWPNAWDVSVGEHLTPGESGLAGAARGLAEELGVHGVLLEPIGGQTQARVDIAALNIHDHEFQRSYRGTYDGPIVADPAEVAEVMLIDRDTLVRAIERAPENYTPWLRERLTSIGWTGV